MKKIAIISRNQFGSNESFNYATNLSKYFNISYYSMQKKDQKRKVNNIETIYLKSKKFKINKINSIINNILFYIFFLKILMKNKFDIYFVAYFPGCSIFKLFFPNHKMVVSIRSGKIRKSKIRRYIGNIIMAFESKIIGRISIISDSLAKKLNIQNYFLSPIGSHIISNCNKSFSRMDLLYVGTLNNRRIMDTIYGFYYFIKSNNINVPLSYTIIGFGRKIIEQNLIDLISDLKLEKYINFIGKREPDELKKYFDNSNIGIAYIPVTEYYNCQPPTKLFEYLLSGMPVIATNTYENSKVINNKIYGEIIDDSPIGFSKGLKKIYNRLNMFDSDFIRQNNIKYEYSNLIKKYDVNNFLDIINN